MLSTENLMVKLLKSLKKTMMKILKKPLKKPLKLHKHQKRNPKLFQLDQVLTTSHIIITTATIITIEEVKRNQLKVDAALLDQFSSLWSLLLTSASSALLDVPVKSLKNLQVLLMTAIGEDAEWVVVMVKDGEEEDDAELNKLFQHLSHNKLPKPSQSLLHQPLPSHQCLIQCSDLIKLEFLLNTEI